MTFEDVRRLPLLQTKSIAEAAEDEQTHDYIVTCLNKLLRGDYGKLGEEDTNANNKELEAGEGKILARYPKAGKLSGDIYIIAYFSEEMAGDIEANHIMIMYPEEY